VRFVYKPVGLVLGIVGGQIAGRTFKSIWRLAAGERDAPNSTDRDRTWKEILAAAALQGAVFGAVKALIDRGGAVQFERLTGVWPGRTRTD
jgi:predicted metal-dependent enzyme (double-stranded beta helix superfamily)